MKACPTVLLLFCSIAFAQPDLEFKGLKFGTATEADVLAMMGRPGFCRTVKDELRTCFYKRADLTYADAPVDSISFDFLDDQLVSATVSLLAAGSLPVVADAISSRYGRPSRVVREPLKHWETGAPYIQVRTYWNAGGHLVSTQDNPAPVNLPLVVLQHQRMTAWVKAQQKASPKAKKDI
jgi:hypothetical protein